MTLYQRRFFVLLDEWLGVLLCLYLYRSGDPAFWWVFAAFVIMVYCISYPWFWRYEYQTLAPKAKTGPATADENHTRLWLHLTSEHAGIWEPTMTYDELLEDHDYEHRDPGTTRDHDPKDLTYSLKKAGAVLSENND